MYTHVERVYEMSSLTVAGKEIQFPSVKEVTHDPVLCEGPVKPNIVFFGEGLPQRFHEVRKEMDENGIDLCIVIGTGLAVSPFNFTASDGGDDVPRVLINLENTAS